MVLLNHIQPTLTHICLPERKVKKVHMPPSIKHPPRPPLRKRLGPVFFYFNVVICHIFPENFTVMPHVVQKL